MLKNCRLAIGIDPAGVPPLSGGHGIVAVAPIDRVRPVAPERAVKESLDWAGQA